MMVALLLQAPLSQDVEADRTLHFSPGMPPGVDLNLMGAKQVDAEMPLEVDDIALAATRSPSLGEWIVARGICPNEHVRCHLTIRLVVFFGINPQTKKQEFYGRYLARSKDGTRTAEGFCRVVSNDLKDHIYWQRKDGFWRSTLDEKDKYREYAHFGGMLAAVRALQQREQEKPLRPLGKPGPTIGPVRS